MSLFKTTVVAFAAASAAVLTAGCDPLECGVGTIEDGDECRAADSAPGDQACGPGTVLGDGGVCVSVTECGEGTNAVPQPDGSVLCVPLGGPAGTCEGLIPQCREPTNGNLVSICGQLIDIQTNLNFDEADADDNITLCDQANPTTSGPCSVQVRAFNPLGFTPESAPQDVGGVFTDNCGRYALNDVELPSTGIVAVATSDVFEPGEDEGDKVADTYRDTGTAVILGAGELAQGITVAVTRNATDEAWTTSAGGPFEGNTLAQRGLFVLAYVVEETDGLGPRDGVRVIRDGSPVFENIFYFGDTEADTRDTIDTEATRTGVNGTVLLVEQVVGSLFGGQGSEPNGCVWPTDQGGTAPDVVFFQQKIAHVDGNVNDNECPQP